MDQLQVTVTIPCEDVGWSKIDLITTPTSTLTVQTIWNSMKDRVYPNAISPPAGF